MSHERYPDGSGDEVVEVIENAGREQNATVRRGIGQMYRQLVLMLEDGVLLNDGTETETLRVEIVNGLEIARGTDISNASLIIEDHTATLTVDGTEVDVTVTDGTGKTDITTTKSDGSTIDVQVAGLTSHAASESNIKTIEVTS